MDNIEITKKMNAGVHNARILFNTSIGMEWNGMEQKGMEWNRMEWNGMEWNVLYYSDNKIKYELLLNTGIYCN